jgi:hypothetical protein
MHPRYIARARPSRELSNIEIFERVERFLRSGDERHL